MRVGEQRNLGRRVRDRALVAMKPVGIDRTRHFVSLVTPVSFVTLVIFGLAIVPVFGLSSAAAQLSEDEIHPFYMAFSSSLFATVNENDARASVRVLATSIARERNVPIHPEPLIYDTLEEIEGAFSRSEVDAVALNTVEFVQLEKIVPEWDAILSARVGHELTETYVLLTRQQGPKHLSELKGKNLLAFREARMCLAELWLDTELADEGLGSATSCFSGIQGTVKLSQAVLPVFFGQADACLVSRRGFATMTELNPQLGRELHVIAESPPVIAAVFCVRASRDRHADNVQPIVDALQTVHETPAGEQVLTVFQSDKLVLIDSGLLDTARTIVEGWTTLTGRAPASSTPELLGTKALAGAGDGR